MVADKHQFLVICGGSFLKAHQHTTHAAIERQNSDTHLKVCVPVRCSPHGSGCVVDDSVAMAAY